MRFELNNLYDPETNEAGANIGYEISNNVTWADAFQHFFQFLQSVGCVFPADVKCFSDLVDWMNSDDCNEVECSPDFDTDSETHECNDCEVCCNPEIQETEVLKCERPVCYKCPFALDNGICASSSPCTWKK